MPPRRIFTVQTPLGHRVFPARDRWRQIIRFKHPALAGHERDVRACLETPSLVRESAKEPDVHLSSTPAGQVHLCVVTAPANDEERFVVTAYFTKTIKPGNELWRN
jgi:hypothetical protein